MSKLLGVYLFVDDILLDLFVVEFGKDNIKQYPFSLYNVALEIIKSWYLCKNVASNIEQVLAATPHKAPTIRPPASHHENYLS